MKVTLISTTQSHIEVDGKPLTPDELIVYIARVSNPSNQHNTATGERLLRYCLNNGHWSIFEHAHMTVEIETSLAIAMQLLRHRSFTFQMFSQRYAEVDKLGDMMEPVELRMKADGGNRQGSGEAAHYYTQDDMKRFADMATVTYTAFINGGIAPESARFVLPQCTKTRLYMTGNARSWIHYLAQRTDPHTQQEHREVAKEIEALFFQVFPTIGKALVDQRDAQWQEKADNELLVHQLAKMLGYLPHAFEDTKWWNPNNEVISEDDLREAILEQIRHNE